MRTNAAATGGRLRRQRSMEPPLSRREAAAADLPANREARAREILDRLTTERDHVRAALATVEQRLAVSGCLDEWQGCYRCG
jgi:hypothetical protein